MFYHYTSTYVSLILLPNSRHNILDCHCNPLDLGNLFSKLRLWRQVPSIDHGLGFHWQDYSEGQFQSRVRIDLAPSWTFGELVRHGRHLKKRKIFDQKFIGLLVHYIMCASTKKNNPPYTWSQFLFIDALPETIKYHGGFPILKWFSFFILNWHDV